MTIYTVYKKDHPYTIIGSCKGTVKGNSFHGIRVEIPFSERDCGLRLTIRKGDIIMKNCFLEYVDSFDVEGQTIYGKGVPF